MQLAPLCSICIHLLLGYTVIYPQKHFNMAGINGDSVVISCKKSEFSIGMLSIISSLGGLKKGRGKRIIKT